MSIFSTMSQEEYDKWEMSRENDQARMLNFFDERTQDELNVLRMMFSMCAVNGKQTAQLFIGMTITAGHMKHGANWDGKTLEDSPVFQEMKAEQASEENHEHVHFAAGDVDTSEVERQAEHSRNLLNLIGEPLGVEPLPGDLEIPDNLREDGYAYENQNTEKYKELLGVYNLELGEKTGKLICKGCGLTYVTLEDRMLREPGDCHGCRERSSHG